MSHAIETSEFKDWEGRSETVSDVIDPSHVTEVAATLDWPHELSTGAPLPHLWHWTFFRPRAATSGLGADGHPPKGGFLPPVALPRRMWAGGRLRFLRPLPVGKSVSRTSTIRQVESKSGRSGNLVFVTVQHDYACGDELCIVEEQDVVYREAAQDARSSGAAAAQSGSLAPSMWTDEFTTNPVLLFRYSAITFNSHRIHYDQEYASNEEGYAGLVVHGPLAATLMLRAYCQREGLETVKGFSFRGVKPLIERGRLSVCCESANEATAKLYVADASGQKTMEGTVSLT